MTNKPFQDVAISSEFTFNDKKYTKIANVRVSCCKSINAVAVDDSQNRIFVQPQQEVQVEE